MTVVFVTLVALIHPVVSAVEIEVGTLAAIEGSENWLLKEIALFEAANPEVKVSTVAITDPPRSKTAIEDLPILARNVVGIDSQPGYETIFLAERDLILPVDAFLPDAEFSFDDFHESYWDAVSYRDKRWGVPWAVSSVALVCNLPLFESAGISAPPATWAELIDIAKRMTRVGEGGEQWGLRINTRGDVMGHVAMSMLFQNRGEFIRNGKFVASSPEVMQTAMLVNNMIVGSGGAKVDRRLPGELVSESPNQYAMDFVLAEDLAPFLRSSRYLIAPLPALSSGQQVTAAPRRLYLAVRRSTPEEEAASWKFIKWISRKDVSLPTRWSIYPCRKDLLDRDDYRKLLSTGPQNMPEFVSSFAHGRDHAEQVYNRWRATYSFYMRFEQALVGNEDFLALAAKAEADANAMLGPLPGNETPTELYLDKP